MNEDITIMKAQIGLTYERISAETGQWTRQYESWYDIPVAGWNNLAARHSLLSERQDYRNIQYAWRGVMTNVIIDDSFEALRDLGQRMIKPPQEKRFVVASGNAFLGMTLLGPFLTDRDAVAWAEGNDVETWDVVHIRSI